MKRVLLDTHALLFFLFDDPRLGSGAAKVIEDRRVHKLLSIASLWELTIKVQLGKLALGMPLDSFFAQFVRGRLLEVLPIELSHLLAYQALALHHRDPFDRLLIAQAQVLRLPIVSSDPSFVAYDVETLW